jgi:D-alanyl-D-alanine dipeptidase
MIDPAAGARQPGGANRATTRPWRLPIPAFALLATLACAPALRPPVETGKRPPDLVELATLDPTLHLDVRYATRNNFVGRPVYEEARAFLQRPAAEALLRAHRALAAKGYGIVVFDGYRPWSVTKLFWEVTPEHKKEFVADPRQGSRHNRGCAVDLSLYASEWWHYDYKDWAQYPVLDVPFTALGAR